LPFDEDKKPQECWSVFFNLAKLFIEISFVLVEINCLKPRLCGSLVYYRNTSQLLWVSSATEKQIEETTKEAFQ
jgi:hypothetical protein